MNGAPSTDYIEATVRRECRVPGSAPVTVRAVEQHSNINYVYRVTWDDRSIFVKAIPPRPKKLPVDLPRERALSEARAIERFHSLAGDVVVVPALLFVDSDQMMIGMSDVGEGRHVLFDVLSQQFHLLTGQADLLGCALGRVYLGTQGEGPLRPDAEEAIIRRIIFDGLLAPGSHHVLGDEWSWLSEEMQARRECMVHGDLWSKNLLVSAGQPLAVVDYEGVHYGDAAFDLGTVMSVAILPALERRHLMADAALFIARLLQSWQDAAGAPQRRAADAVKRAFRTCSCFLASRGFGPFAYPMSPEARERTAELAWSLWKDPVSGVDPFCTRLLAQTQPRAHVAGGLPA